MVPGGVEGAPRSPSYPRGYAPANNVRINFSNISDLNKRILSRNTNFNNFLTNFHLMQKQNRFSLRNHCMLALQNPKTREGLSSHLRSSLSDANAADLSYTYTILYLEIISFREKCTIAIINDGNSGNDLSHDIRGYWQSTHRTAYQLYLIIALVAGLQCSLNIVKKRPV